MTRRKLRKAERDQVAAAVTPSVEHVRSAVLEIEREIVERLLPSVPADVREHALHEFMNEVGREIFAEAELSQITEEGQDR